MPLGLKWGMLVASCLVAAHVWQGLRTVYAQGVVRTTLKGALLGAAYGVLLMIGLSITIVWTFLRL